MADKQWGSAGALNYLNLAKAQINNIWLHEIVDSKLAGPGDGWGPTDLWKNINISYFAPAYYRVFGRVTGQTTNWNNVTKTSYDVIERTLTTQNGNANNGLVPAWSTPAGMPMAPSGTSMRHRRRRGGQCRAPVPAGVPVHHQGVAERERQHGRHGHDAGELHGAGGGMPRLRGDAIGEKSHR